MSSENKNLIKAGLASATLHGLVVSFGFLNIFEPRIENDMFLNIELAGAAEMQQALKDFHNGPIIEEPQPKSEIIPTKELLPEEARPKLPKPEEIKQPEPLPEQPVPQPVPRYEEIPEEQLVKGPSIVEPEPEPEKEPEIEEQPQELGESLPAELKDEEALRIEKLEQEKLEKERLEREKAENERQEKLRKERERKRRLEKKKKEAIRRRKKRLEAIKRIEKKNKEKKKRLAKIADAVEKNNNAKKKQDDSFSKMLKSEKKTLGRFSGSKGNVGSGNGNGLGSYGDGMGFVDSDAAIISNQIIPHWVVAGGVKNAESLIIRIRIKVKDNGEVPASSIEILDKDRYNSNSVFKSAADSAKRAILRASPLKIPAEKMHIFRDFEISFNTDKALGVRK